MSKCSSAISQHGAEDDQKRFASLTAEEIAGIGSNKDSDSTKKAVEKSVRALRSFLTETGKDPGFEQYEIGALDAALELFFGNARTVKGELYKVSSFNQLRYGIHKHILEKKNVDINSNTNFKKSRDTFLKAG